MFGADSYLDFMNYIRGSSKSFGDYFDARLDTVILRHDVDFSLDSAVSIAKIDREMNIKSSFFFMLSSNMYNLMSSCSQEKIFRIAEMGHRISLHFDPTAHDDIDRGFDLEKNIFERLFNIELDIVSLHRPGKFLENNNRQLEGVKHTYEDIFFKDMVYLSDSAGTDCRIKWVEVLNESVNTKSSIQLLLHPIWWSFKSDSPTQTLMNNLKQKSQFLLQETKCNCKTFYPNL